MSYQVLARKWRPQNFSQLVGQEHVKTALTHALAQNRLHHAYLFTGTRGVGKTTIARIFAKSLNCELGVTATPCGVCSACREIDQGFFVDLLEIDAASRTKVEDTRDLLDNVQYAPTRGRYKVYLIDEVHMLSRHSFNALLKTLEEPPPHVKFLLATTDPQKLPITVLSRCLQFSLKALSQQQIKQHLSYVLEQEQVAAEDEALALLARAAKGSLRDSLSLTDQAIAQTNGQIQLGAVREMLGYLEQSWAELLLQDVLNRDLSAMQTHMQQLVSSHSHFQGVLDDMLSLLHLTALSQFQLSASELALTESAFVRATAKAISPESVQLYYQLLLSGKKDLPFAPEPRIGLEMALMRAIAFVPAKAHSASAQPARQAALQAAQSVHATTASTVEVSNAAALPSAATSSTASVDLANVELPQSTVELPTEVSPEPVVHVQLQSAPKTGLAEHSTELLSSSVADSGAAATSLTASILARRLGGSATKKPEAGDAGARVAQSAAITARVALVNEPAGNKGSTASVSTLQYSVERAAVNQAVVNKTPAGQSATDPSEVPPWDIAASTTLVNSPSSMHATDSLTRVKAVHDAKAVQSPTMVASADVAVDNLPALPLQAKALAGNTGAEEDELESEMLNSDAWQWQTMPEMSAQPTDMSAQLQQPIRHALLDSLTLSDDHNTDFASEAIESIQPIEVDNEALTFNGVIDSQNFSLRSASQVDAWARRIDSLPIGGLMRLFLLNSRAQQTGDLLTLTVALSQQHLDSERNRAQLQQVLSTSFGEPLRVEIEYLPEVSASPQALQQQIDQARRLYVQKVLQADPLLQSLQAEWNANWLEDSLEVF